MTPEIRIRRFPSGFIVEQLQGELWVTCGTMQLCQTLFPIPNGETCAFSNLSASAREFFRGSPVIDSTATEVDPNHPARVLPEPSEYFTGDDIQLAPEYCNPAPVDMSSPEYKEAIEYWNCRSILYKFEDTPNLLDKPPRCPSCGCNTITHGCFCNKEPK